MLRSNPLAAPTVMIRFFCCKKKCQIEVQGLCNCLANILESCIAHIAMENCRLFLIYQINNGLTNTIRCGNTWISKAEIKYIFPVRKSREGDCLPRTSYGLQNCFYIWFHFFCYHFMSLLFCLFLIKISLLFRLIFPNIIHPTVPAPADSQSSTRSAQPVPSAEHIIISFQINHNYNRRNHITACISVRLQGISALLRYPPL